MQSQNLVKNKSCKIYFIVQNTKVYFNADFDSGNVEKVEQITPYCFKIYPGFDKSINSTTKTFFYFKVFGLKMCKANFIITRMYMLQKFITTTYDKSSQLLPQYYPLYRKPNQQFKKVKLEVKKYYNVFDQPQLSFSFEFDNDPYVQFAFSYPYSYEQCEKFIDQINKNYLNHPTIYLHDEILCFSQQQKKVHLLTITDKQNCSFQQRQAKIQGIFPLSQNNQSRPLKIDKPLVLMTARVHPGQSPASFCIEGAIKFLLNEKDCRSYLLRKNFQFLIIPMLNPDGVYNGMFRNDMNGHNLNRVYLTCDKKKHPTIWSVKQLASWLAKNKNVLFYFDFHAHPSTKNFFIYGNSFNQIAYQTEAQIFGKMIQANCPYFQNFDSIFAEKQMKIKLKNDIYSKQGCARVFMHKLFNIIHSYTVECGYFGPVKVNTIQDKQQELTYSTGNFTEQNDFQNLSKKSYKPQNYMLMGKSILITILDLFGLNPYPKKIKGSNLSVIELRKSYGNRIYHEIDKFRLTDANCYRKLNDLSTVIETVYYNEKLKGTNIMLSSNEKNKLLQEQLIYINSSPRSKKLMKKGLDKITKSFSVPKIKNQFIYKQINSEQNSLNQKKVNKFISSTPLPDKQKLKASKRNGTQQRMNKQKTRKSVKSQQMKYQYNQVERFNQTSYDQAPLSHSQKNISIKCNQIKQKYHLGKYCQSLTKQEQELIEKKIGLNNQFNTTLKVKQFKPDAHQRKIQTTLEKSMTLRKGSLSKIVFIKKDQLKLLRLTHLLSKTDRKQSKSYKKNNQKNILPEISSKFKTDY